MWETSARLLRLLSLLQAHREWAGHELASRLEVSERTVRRDVDRLRGLGYPVEATRGRVGGYRLGAFADMPPLLLDDEEAVAIAVGLRTAARSSVTGIEDASLRALAKLEQVLPVRLRARVGALAATTVEIPPDSPAPPVDAELLALLAAAARDHETVRFDYLSHEGAESLRRAEPHRLVVCGRRWYLLAWDVDRADSRTYGVDRIGHVRTPVGPRFAPREVPDDLATSVARDISAAGFRVRARIVVRTPADELAARLPAAVGIVEALAERRCLLSTGADSLETVALYLGMLGADFEVVEPPELLAHVRELTGRYTRSVEAGPAASGSGGREIGPSPRLRA